MLSNNCHPGIFGSFLTTAECSSSVMLLEGIGRPSRTMFPALFLLIFFCSSISLGIHFTFLFLAFLKCFNISFFGNFSFFCYRKKEKLPKKEKCAAFVCRPILLIHQKYCYIITFSRLVVFENVKCFTFAAQSLLMFDLLLLAVYPLQLFHVVPLFAISSYKD